MSVWIICDQPDCDTHVEPKGMTWQPDLRKGTIALSGVWHGWTGAPWDARCPNHAKDTR